MHGKQSTSVCPSLNIGSKSSQELMKHQRKLPLFMTTWYAVSILPKQNTTLQPCGNSPTCSLLHVDVQKWSAYVWSLPILGSYYSHACSCMFPNLCLLANYVRLIIMNLFYTFNPFLNLKSTQVISQDQLVGFSLHPWRLHQCQAIHASFQMVLRYRKS